MRVSLPRVDPGAPAVMMDGEMFNRIMFLLERAGNIQGTQGVLVRSTSAGTIISLNTSIAGGAIGNPTQVGQVYQCVGVGQAAWQLLEIAG